MIFLEELPNKFSQALQREEAKQKHRPKFEMPDTALSRFLSKPKDAAKDKVKLRFIAFSKVSNK